MLGKTSGPFLSCGNPGKLFTADRHWWKSGEVKICPTGRGDYLWFVPQGGDDPSPGQHLEFVLAQGGGCLAGGPWCLFPQSHFCRQWAHHHGQWGQATPSSSDHTQSSLSPIHPHWPATAWITSQLPDSITTAEVLAKVRRARHESWSPPFNLQNQASRSGIGLQTCWARELWNPPPWPKLCSLLNLDLNRIDCDIWHLVVRPSVPDGSRDTAESVYRGLAISGDQPWAVRDGPVPGVPGRLQIQPEHDGVLHM